VKIVGSKYARTDTNLSSRTSITLTPWRSWSTVGRGQYRLPFDRRTVAVGDVADDLDTPASEFPLLVAQVRGDGRATEIRQALEKLGLAASGPAA
jgi:hypothetical protein